jgi:hypothetical protein
MNRRRREIGGVWVSSALFVLAALSCAICLGCGSSSSKPAVADPSTRLPTSAAPTPDSSIAGENTRPGTTSWQITNPAVAGEIAGYANSTSYNRGDTVDLHISTRTPGQRHEIAVYRMGWYGGTGARLVKVISDLTGQAQGYWSPGESLHACARCKLDAKTGLLDANWEISYRLKLDKSWPSGAYIAKLQDVDGKQAYIPFVVRDDSRHADVLVQLSVNTWQAYNAWGDRSLYGAFNDRRVWVTNQPRAQKVSFNRPYDPLESGMAGFGAGQFFFWEYNFVRWAESQGYDMTYATDVDLHARKGLLKQRRGFVSLGHDEYWSWQQRDQVEAARDAGVGVAFFGGNNVYWQVRFEPDERGVANRTLVCYKDASLDPAAKSDPKRTTVLWSKEPVNRPEVTLTGTIYGGMAAPPRQPWVVADTGSWVYAGSGLKQGDSVPGLLGYEYDRLGSPAAQPKGLQVLALSARNTAASTVYVAPSGAPVFNAGTIQWPWGLDDLGHEKLGHFADARVQAVTKNVLEAMIKGVPKH